MPHADTDPNPDVFPHADTDPNPDDTDTDTDTDPADANLDANLDADHGDTGALRAVAAGIVQR